MNGSGYFTRLFAMLVVAAGLGVLIARPDAGVVAVDKVAALKPERAPLAARACARGEPALAGAFAPIEDVLSVSPLGAVTAPGEPLPAPYIRINTRKGATVFERRETEALAPARADIVAVERRLVKAGDTRKESWTVHFAACDTIAFYYDRLDRLDPALMKRIGGLKQFREIGGPQHLAAETDVRVNLGAVIGYSDGFDVGLHDLGAAAATLARPERYRSNPYARAAVFDTPPSLHEAISTDHAKARCPLNYMTDDLKEAWTDKLGDAFGMRRARGENACRTQLIDLPDTAQGAWFTDASHNAATEKVSAIALAADTIDQSRLIFALHGRAPSLSPDMIALPPMLEEQRIEASRDFLTFEKGDGRINTPFALVAKDKMHCYNRLRANFVGPKVLGVVLLQTSETEDGAEILKLEAIGDVMTCIDLSEPWAFTGNETTFYR
ncbi:MAG: hypothetical protein AAGJ87_04885 [Pseudomonadota bacterium]